MTQEAPAVLGLPEIAKRLGINYQTARRWASEGKLPVFRYHDKSPYMAFEEHIDLFLAKLKNQAAAVVNLNE